MGSFSDYLEDKLLDHTVGKASFTMPSVWIALSTADPLDDGSGMAEPGAGSYARKSTAAGDWNSASGGAIDNANDITFVEATASWGTITHFALFDALTVGNMLAHGTLGTPKAIGSGDTAKFAAGDLDITLD